MGPEERQPPTPAQSYSPQPFELEPEDLQGGEILLNVVIVAGLTFLGGFGVGFAFAYRGMRPSPMLLLATSNLLAMIGFVISGIRAPRGNRWRHLVWVAIGVWFVNAVNMMFGMTESQWLYSALPIVVVMAIGGLISMALRPSE